MKNNIILYNHFHNGDIFFARMLINILIEKYDITFYHNLKTPLLNDIDGVNEINGIPEILPIHDNYLDKFLVNTWIGQKGMIYVSKINNGCTFENYVVLCKEISNFYSIEIGEVEDLIPDINFQNLNGLDIIDDKLNSFGQFKKRVLISNGPVLSQQSINFDFTEIINEISNKHKDILFIVTEPINSHNINVICSDVLTSAKPDLLYISYISTKCDIIIGRASGPHTFARIKRNLMDSNKTFISFNHTYSEGKFYENQKSKFIWSNNYTYENIINTINQNI